MNKIINQPLMQHVMFLKKQVSYKVMQRFGKDTTVLEWIVSTSQRIPKCFLHYGYSKKSNFTLLMYGASSVGYPNPRGQATYISISEKFSYVKYTQTSTCASKFYKRRYTILMGSYMYCMRMYVLYKSCAQRARDARPAMRE